jgi:2-succinyl-6-hydroxy-2,4-cyclohexadiene-1-carboxylate synthase
MAFDNAASREQGPVLSCSARGRGPRTVLVHGFTQTSSSWARVCDDLAENFEVVTVDLPGHGRSPVPGPGSDLSEAGRAVGCAGGKATYVGYSLGGRCCLHLALENPGLVERLVIVGAHPGISEEPERRSRRGADEELAAGLERGGDAAVPEFIDTWLEGPLFAHMTKDQADRPSRLANSAAGLAASLRTVGTGTQAPSWERLADLQMPVLVVVGARDSKFRPIAEQTAEAIGANARLAVVAGAGHGVCFERPLGFAALLRQFLGAGA